MANLSMHEIALYAARYAALRELGAAPADAPCLKNGTVLCFTNLDEHCDALLKRRPPPAKIGTWRCPDCCGLGCGTCAGTGALPVPSGVDLPDGAKR